MTYKFQPAIKVTYFWYHSAIINVIWSQFCWTLVAELYCSSLVEMTKEAIYNVYVCVLILICYYGNGNKYFSTELFFMSKYGG